MDSGMGIVFVWFSISSLTKLLFIKKTFCINTESASRSLQRHWLLSRKIREDRQENKEQGAMGWICSLYSYTFLIYITICNTIMLNFQAHFISEKKALKERYTIKFV